MAARPQGIRIPAVTDTAPRLAHGGTLRRVGIAGLGALAVLLVGGGVLLWMRHGVAIFFDTVAAGLATCF
ncbi:hypothetical protein [Azorhizobium sp. AG788]|uniref:hypothetical protein n=1 Tax=Azorhizobium sp. AG788 TaxID=2183897 RepID=UPI0031398799